MPRPLAAGGTKLRPPALRWLRPLSLIRFHQSAQPTAAPAPGAAPRGEGGAEALRGGARGKGAGFERKRGKAVGGGV